MSGDLVIARLDRARTALAEAVSERDVLKVKELRDLGKSAQTWARERKLGKESEAKAREFVLLTDRNLARLTKDAPKNKGVAGKAGPGRGKRGGKVPPRLPDDPPTLADIGIDKDTAKEVRAVGSLSEEEFQRVIDEGVSPAKVTKQAREKKAKAVLAAIKPVPVDGLHIGDFRELATSIPDASVDLIFTDPPYDRDSIPLFGDLGAIAARILKPGGSLICYCGQIQLPEVLPLLSAHLRYWWTCACIHSGGANQMHEYGIKNQWKPMLWFVKESRGDKLTFIDDAVSGGIEKSHHEWQQAESEAAYFIGRLTQNLGLVVDPFAGGGTTCVAAERLGRRWLGYEIDAGHAARAGHRIDELRKAAA